MTTEELMKRIYEGLDSFPVEKEQELIALVQMIHEASRRDSSTLNRTLDAWLRTV